MATVFTQAGEEFVVDLIDGGTANDADHVGWGTGAGTAAKGDTDLFTPATEARVQATRSQPVADKVRWLALITADGAKTITNAGVFPGAGAGGTVRQQAFRKIAGGGEGAPTVTYSGTTGIIARVAGWSGINTVSTVDVDGADTGNNNNNATVTFAAVTTPAANDLVVFLGVDEGTGGTFIGVISGSPTPTERFDSVIGTTGPHIFLADMNKTPAGSTTSRTATLSVGGARIGRQISFRELKTFSQS